MPRRLHNALSAAQVKTAGPGVYTDGNGLELRVDQHGRRWVHRVTVNGKRANMGLGSYPTVSLKDARVLALNNLQAIREGRNPLDEKRQRRSETLVPQVPTFQDFARSVHDVLKTKWTSERHAAQWLESLRLHVYPHIGRRPIDQVTRQDVKDMIAPIWTTKSETARRVLQRMHTIFDAACDAEYREDNPAALSRKLLPQQAQTQNHPALPYREVPAALQTVRESTSEDATKLSFEFLVLTAGRSGEIREARWSEIDLDRTLWTIPSERMKARSEHRVPLSTRAVEILHEARALGGSELVFPNRRSGTPLSNMTFNRLLDRRNIPATTHGFRSSFRTWALEQSNASFEACEAALAHTLWGGGVASLYIRTDLLEARRPLMQSWCDYLITC